MNLTILFGSLDSLGTTGLSIHDACLINMSCKQELGPEGL